METIDKYDLAFLYGFGLFETFLVNDFGEVFLLDKHIERMFTSADNFKIILSFTKEEATEQILQFINSNNLRNIILRITLSAGNIDLNISSKLMFTIRQNPYTSDKILAGTNIMIGNVLRNETSNLVKHKTTNYLENFLLLQEAIAKGFDDLIFINTKKQVAETTKANIFFVENNILCTPSLDTGILPGIMREWTINTAKKNGIAVKESGFTLKELIKADEIFLTNSVFGLMNVKKIDGNNYNLLKTNSTTKQLRDEFFKICLVGNIF